MTIFPHLSFAKFNSASSFKSFALCNKKINVIFTVLGLFARKNIFPRSYKYPTTSGNYFPSMDFPTIININIYCILYKCIVMSWFGLTFSLPKWFHFFWFELGNHKLKYFINNQHTCIKVSLVKRKKFTH